VTSSLQVSLCQFFAHSTVADFVNRQNLADAATQLRHFDAEAAKQLWAAAEQAEQQSSPTARGGTLDNY
jgi:hypothetical protein